MARAADVVRRSFEYSGKAARALAALLVLPPDRAATIALELSQGQEHRALPDRDAALRAAAGFLPGDLDARVSSVIRLAVAWDPQRAVLRLDGYVADRATAFPHEAGPQYSFVSPGVVRDNVDAIAAWKPLFEKLAALPARSWGTGDERRLDLDLDERERAVASLYRVATWDARNQPVELFTVGVSIGPWIGGTGPWIAGTG